MKFIDLFCGIGGISYGFKKAGLIPLMGIDIDETAGKVYEKFINPLQGFMAADLFKLDPASLPDVEIIAGGPPCQGFSTVNGAGRSSKKNDRRNQLIKIFGDIVLAKRPLIFFFENVPPVKNTRRFMNMVNRLKEIYEVEYRIVDLGTLGGGPWEPKKPLTHRRRLICIGVKKGLNIKPDILFPQTEENPLPLKEVLRIGNKGDTRRRNLSERLLKLAEYIKPGMKRTDVPADIQKKYFYKCWLNTEGFKDVFSRIDPEKPLPYITGGILRPDKGPFLHPEEHRGFTVEEAKYIMSFPQELDLSKVPLRKIESYLGNAFPPQSAYAFGKKIMEVFGGKDIDISKSKTVSAETVKHEIEPVGSVEI